MIMMKCFTVYSHSDTTIHSRGGGMGKRKGKETANGPLELKDYSCGVQGSVISV